MSQFSLSARGRGLIQHLAIKDAAEVRGQALGNLFQRGAHAQLRHGGHRLGQAAGNDVLEIAQVGGDVQRETVRGDPSADVHADGADFAPAHPNAGQLGNAAGLDAEIGQRIDDGLLDGPDVSAHVALPFAQVQDGIADELAGAVIGDVAAAVGGMKAMPARSRISSLASRFSMWPLRPR
jgi:hypothetical protein